MSKHKAEADCCMYGFSQKVVCLNKTDSEQTILTKIYLYNFQVLIAQPFTLTPVRLIIGTGKSIGLFIPASQ